MYRSQLNTIHFAHIHLSLTRHFLRKLLMRAYTCRTAPLREWSLSVYHWKNKKKKEKCKTRRLQPAEKDVSPLSIHSHSFMKSNTVGVNIISPLPNEPIFTIASKSTCSSTRAVLSFAACWKWTLSTGNTRRPDVICSFHFPCRQTRVHLRKERALRRPGANVKTRSDGLTVCCAVDQQKLRTLELPCSG